jgi:DNA-binding MarR family transcriptional regulator
MGEIIPPAPARLANLLGALGVGLSDLAAAAVTSATGLDETAAAALLTVTARPGRSVSDLAAALGTTHSGAVRTADRLEDLGLLRRRHGADRRTACLELTGLGHQLSDRALAARREAMADLLGRVDTAALPALQVAITKILQALPRTRQDAWHICRLCEHAVCRGPYCPVGTAVTDRPAAPARRERRSS